MKEKVDVLVATYNGEKYLREQLDSIIKQTYKNIRILISDDCSKDRTQEILQEYEKKDDRIKIERIRDGELAMKRIWRCRELLPQPGTAALEYAHKIKNQGGF